MGCTKSKASSSHSKHIGSNNSHNKNEPLPGEIDSDDAEIMGSGNPQVQNQLPIQVQQNNKEEEKKSVHEENDELEILNKRNIRDSSSKQIKPIIERNNVIFFKMTRMELTKIQKIVIVE